MEEQLPNIDSKLIPRKMDPITFMLWLFMVSVIMIFAAWTSAYLVGKSDGNWMVVELPKVFIYTSLLALASSLTMQFSFVGLKRNSKKEALVYIGLSILLALVFIGGQFVGFSELVATNVYFVGNKAGSFIYVFVFFHILHLVGGILYALILSYRIKIGKVNSENRSPLARCITFWHFLGALWIYLYFFLLLNVN